MNKEQTEGKQKSLRLISPKLYHYITEELQEKYNIHSYDLQIDAAISDEGQEIIIRYGETFSHNKSILLKHEQIDEINNEINKFITETGEACTKVLIDDYFKIYAP